jgi:hypothetical protein
LTPNEEQLAFYHQIGMAVTQWASVEFALYEIMTACFGDKEQINLNVTFFSIENFRSKLQLIDNLISVKYKTTPHYAEWLKILTRIEAASKGRNTLVHYWVLIYLMESPGRRWCLVPRLPNLRKPPPKRQQKMPAGALSVRDVSLLAQRFGMLSIELSNFAQVLRGRPERLPISPESEPRPMTLPELRRLIRALSGHPQQSSRK